MFSRGSSCEGKSNSDWKLRTLWTLRVPEPPKEIKEFLFRQERGKTMPLAIFYWDCKS